MHASAISLTTRRPAGRTLTAALALSALLHALLLFADGGPARPRHPALPDTASPPLEIQLRAETVPPVAARARPSRTTPAPAAPRTAATPARHRARTPAGPASRQRETAAAPPVRTTADRAAAPVTDPVPATRTRSHGAPLSRQSLLDQAVAYGAADLAPARPAGQLVYGRSARGPLWNQYMDDWVRRMERLGAMNYPEEVRRQGLTGGPTLSVVINADGSLRTLRIVRSSGNATLDAAADRMVRASAPFAPFPPQLAQQAGSLEIRRKWTFSTDSDLSVQ